MNGSRFALVFTPTSAFPISWQDVAESGFFHARKALRNLTGRKMVEEKAGVEDGKISEFLVTFDVMFVPEENDC